MSTSFTEIKRLKLPGLEISFAFLLIVISLSFVDSEYSTVQIVLILGATVAYVLHLLYRLFPANHI